MIPLTAKDNYFKTHTEKERSDLLAILNSTPVQTAMVYALSDLAERGVSVEAIRGACAFRNLLLNIGEAAVPAADFKPVHLERVPNTPDGR